MVIALIQLYAILILLHRLRLGHQGMILSHKRPAKAAKHLHYPQLVLTMCAARRGVEDHFFARAAVLTADKDSAAAVPAPQVAVHENGADASRAPEVVRREETRHDVFGGAFDDFTKFGVLTVASFAAL